MDELGFIVATIASGALRQHGELDISGIYGKRQAFGNVPYPRQYVISQEQIFQPRGMGDRMYLIEFFFLLSTV